MAEAVSVSGACLPAVSVTMSIELYMAREHTSYVLSATVHVLHCSILSTRIWVDLQVGAREISSDILGGACIRLSYDLSQIFAEYLGGKCDVACHAQSCAS